ncbi:HIT domain-containing protein [Nakamurella sp. YIM 132087]|uniref:HIT domain-containing protein n=1 Tax=Nakamurella alba TaxID=2665158 RepID=A0A7K1FKZ4_9ACTN|nr:HIT family protein [Nakamurella alba]MTD14059.1 HIT domain-containing protein [Nakamurella alba]
MPSIFSRIIAGELPGTFVWQDDDVVAFLSIAPIIPGHTLVVPRQEIDIWTDLPADLLAKVTDVSAHIGRAVTTAFDAPRSGVIIAGFEVPHTHVHVFPASELGVFDFSRAQPVDPSELLAPAEKIREALRAAGRSEVAG